LLKYLWWWLLILYPVFKKQPNFPRCLQTFIQYPSRIHHSGSFTCINAKKNFIKTRFDTWWFKIQKLYLALILTLIIDNTSAIDFQPHPAHRRLYKWPCIHHKRNGRLLTHTDLIFGQQRHQSNFGLHQSKTHIWNGEFKIINFGQVSTTAQVLSEQYSYSSTQNIQSFSWRYNWVRLWYSQKFHKMSYISGR
jgi:hypothetical protein